MNSRRRFLQQLAAVSAGALVIPTFDITAHAQEKAAATAGAGEAGQPSVVAVARGKEYAKLVEKVVADLGGIGKFVSKGDKVVVKPNIGWDRNVEQGANTHPIVVVALVKLALDAGAKQVLVFDRTCNEAKRCYVNSGIQQAVADIGDKRAVCEFIDNRKWAKLNIAKGKSVTEWEFYREAVECDCYINAPIAKHHGLAKLTLGLKNTMGILNGNRGQIHQDIGQKLADINTVIPCKLTVIDATRILLAHGPQGGDLKDVKVLDTVIASADPVAADAYATTLFGKKPDEIASTVAAYKMGMGEMDLSKIRVIEA